MQETRYYESGYDVKEYVTHENKLENNKDSMGQKHVTVMRGMGRREEQWRRETRATRGPGSDIRMQ